MKRHWSFQLHALLLVLGLCLMTRSVQSHQLDSASLVLTEIGEGRFAVRWHPGSEALSETVKAPAEFPKPCHLNGTHLDCGPVGIAGTIEFPWLKGSARRVLVQVDWRSGTRLQRVVDGRTPSLMVYGAPAASGWRLLKPIAVDYTRLGIEHILTGFDHLLFVLALTLLVRNVKQLLATITAFTVAHSLTLALTVLGWLSLPSAPVEATIALSIVLVCTECLRPKDSLAHRAPWVVAFVFGLLHGLGFASSLLEIGLPEKHLPAALVLFNVGVELGQLSVITLIALAAWLLTRLNARKAWTSRGLIYAIGGLAAYWSIERGMTIFGQ